MAMNRHLMRMAGAALLLAALPASAGAAPNTQSVMLGNGDTGNFTLHQVSFAEMPFRTVVRQQFDYSCGSAALATLLRYHYGRDTSEAMVFQAMYAVGDQARIQKLGFSCWI